MDPLTAPLVFKTVLIGGLALWLTVIVLNNITDQGTNITLIGRMMGMDLIKADPEMGNGLEWRALGNEAVHRAALWLIIAHQFVTVVLLWRGAFLLMRTSNNPLLMPDALAAVNLALSAKLLLWFGFLIGGLWFGYWMKQGPVQIVHFTLLIVTVLAALTVNF